MLIQFTVENYKSYKEKAILSLLATREDAHREHLVSAARGPDKNVLRCAAVYGSNASGKSNLIDSMAVAQRLITTKGADVGSVAIPQHKLGKPSDPYSRFQFVFSHDGIQYSYGFAVDNRAVREEYLTANSNGHESKYFERVTLDDLTLNVAVGDTLTRGERDARVFLKYKAADTRPNQLFLNAIFDGNLIERLSRLKPVMDWFRNCLVVIPAVSANGPVELQAHRNELFRLFLARLLKSAGTGIQGVDTREEVLDWDRDMPWVPSWLRTDVVEQLNRAAHNETVVPAALSIRTPGGGNAFLRKNVSGETVFTRLRLKHESEDNQTIDFSVSEESGGTQRAIDLAPALFVMGRGQAVVIIDELERSLHPHLSRFIVDVALASPGNNQLVFTTHDTNLLDLDLLRRDEIWFVEKDRAGASVLYSLAEFKVRPDLLIEKGYLNGRFGAIPLIGDVDDLGLGTELDDSKELTHA